MRRLGYLLKIIIALFIISFGFSLHTHAQSKRPKKEKQEKSAQKKDLSDKQKKRADYNKGVDRHSSIQDKKTRRRMKKTRKRSMIHAGKKKLPFYKRWFKRA